MLSHVPALYLQTETALAYDAYELFARALHAYSEAQEVNTVSLPCDKVHTWRHGNSLLNYMKSVSRYSMMVWLKVVRC